MEFASNGVVRGERKIAVHRNTSEFDEAYLPVDNGIQG